MWKKGWPPCPKLLDKSPRHNFNPDGIPHEFLSRDCDHKSPRRCGREFFCVFSVFIVGAFSEWVFFVKLHEKELQKACLAWPSQLSCPALLLQCVGLAAAQPPLDCPPVPPPAVHHPKTLPSLPPSSSGRQSMCSKTLIFTQQPSSPSTWMLGYNFS